MANLKGKRILVTGGALGSFLQRCGCRVLDQKIRGLRILVVDHASTDDSWSLARRLAAIDPRIIIKGASNGSLCTE